MGEEFFMEVPSRIYLVGFMGAGKSTLGGVLAEALGYEFVDLDGYIEECVGRRIVDIFEVEGEGEFRGMESRGLREVSEGEGRVIACGGGVVEREQNVGFLEGAGCVVYLEEDFEVLYGRVAGCGSRPLVRGREGLLELYKRRVRLYEGVADVVVRCGERGARELVGEVVEGLGGVHLG